MFFDMMIDLAEKDLNIKIRKKGLPEQSFYKRKDSDKRKLSQAFHLMDKVRQILRVMPRVGTRKQCHLLGDDCDVGRDKLLAILSSHLLIKPHRSYHITTNSKHMLHKHKNLIIDLPIVCPEQVWESNITNIGN